MYEFLTLGQAVSLHSNQWGYCADLCQRLFGFDPSPIFIFWCLSSNTLKVRTGENLRNEAKHLEKRYISQFSNSSARV